jgi:hypothetical protein
MPAVADSETLFIKRLDSMHDLQGGKANDNENPGNIPNPESRVSRSKIVPITVSAEPKPKRKTQVTKATYSKDASIAELPSTSHLKAISPNKTFLSTSSNSGVKHRLARVSLSCPKVIRSVLTADCIQKCCVAPPGY